MSRKQISRQRHRRHGNFFFGRSHRFTTWVKSLRKKNQLFYYPFRSINDRKIRIRFEVLAWLIIPLPVRFVFLNGYIELPSWRIFLLLSAIPSSMAFLCLLFFDESPKFLMHQNRNEEAMKVFKRIYSMNTGKSAESFPVRIEFNRFE
ncbi:MFS transporter [Sodalis-like endosymbiont of Proechinophthirus fluctus]|uniref:MFS transporter n=1 Tax=Sodalis-like endosymbiont of Proechinophthirus fluctus TaxID=1462730 RepID=UPI001650BE30